VFWPVRAGGVCTECWAAGYPIGWVVIPFGPSTFAIFDAFADDAGRKAHLAGKIAAALMAKAPELLAEAPKIEQVDVLAAKLPG
jgi:hypothetical protein